LVIGGGFMFDYAPSPSFEAGGVSGSLPDITQMLIGLGAYFDFYLSPEGGLHLPLFLGWGGVETSVDGDVGGSDPTGFMGYAGVGWDTFIGDEWSVGVMGRLLFGSLSFNDAGFTLVSPGVVATLTYH